MDDTVCLECGQLPHLCLCLLLAEEAVEHQRLMDDLYLDTIGGE